MDRGFRLSNSRVTACENPAGQTDHVTDEKTLIKISYSDYVEIEVFLEMP